jgi:hypothetical protein
MSETREVDGFTQGRKYKLKRGTRWLPEGTVVTPTSAGKDTPDSHVIVGTSGKTVMVSRPKEKTTKGLFVAFDWLEPCDG